MVKFVNSQSSDVLTEVKYFYPDGKVASIGFMRNNKPDGYWISFHPNGVKASEGNRVNYLLDGKWIFYDTLGNISNITEYKNGFKNGSSLNFIDGVLIDSCFYSDDLIYGKKFYYEDNFIRKIIEYKDGLEDGLGFEFDEKGELSKLLYYKKGILFKELKVNQKNSDGLLNGIFVQLHDNNTIKVEGFYKNGKKNGMFKYYSKSGELIRYEIWENDILMDNVKSSNLLTNKVEYFTGTFNKKKSGFYVFDSIPVGRHDFFDTNGDLLKSEIYDYNGRIMAEGLFDSNGKRYGKWIEYYENGKIKSIGHYNGDLPDGHWRYYFEDGSLAEEGVYRKGLIEGVWKYYCINQQIRKISNFVDGKLDGISVEYDCNGDTILILEYDYGLKNGRYIRKVNNFIEEGAYKDDRKVNKWKSYTSEGILVSEVFYIEDLANGPATYFHLNGKVSIRGIYKSGKRNGVWNYFDLNGNKYLTVEYKDDITVKINGKKL